MPELPEARRARMIAEYGITEQDAHTLTATRAFADQFEAAARAAKNPRRVANLVQSELTMRLKAAGLELEQSPDLDERRRSGRRPRRRRQAIEQTAQAALRSQFRAQRGFRPVVYEREKPQQISDASTLEKMIDDVIAANPAQVEQYRKGKKTVAAFFVGQVMKTSKGQANPALLNELVTKKLDA